MVAATMSRFAQQSTWRHVWIELIHGYEARNVPIAKRLVYSEVRRTDARL